jgi:hypothetical protein
MIAVPYDKTLLYKAFISYSHAADGKLAPALQRTLHGFAKPWYRLRAIRVFRDKTSLSLTPALWPTIEKALDDSEYFILLASPEATASHWVQQEVHYWLEHKSPDKLLIVLTAGEISWDSTVNNFDRARTTSLPESLQGAFKEEPLFLDLSWAKEEEQVSPRQARFRDGVASLAATLHGKPVDELSGEDVRQHRRTKQVAWAAVTALSVLTVAAVVAAVIAAQQKNLAEDRYRVALSRQLASQSENKQDACTQ